MADDVAIRAIQAGDVGAAADMLARAFQDDPGALIVEPDPTLRHEADRTLFAPVVRYAIPYGRVLVAATDDGRILGVATFLPAGHATASDEEMVAAGLMEAVAAVPEAAARMGPMVDYLEELHARAIDGPHARLEFYGVDPAAQGSGVGSRLMAAGHATIDATGERCYLETFTTKNVAFYEKRGYRVVIEGTVPGTETPVWGLVRDPRADGLAELGLGPRRAGR
jgi:ribosomal protein S18 acetylase RimI-like enzyme